MHDLVIVFCLFAAPPLPHVAEADWPAVRARSKDLLAVLKKQDAIPADVAKKWADLLAEDVKDADRALERLQDMLDPLCLIGVHINPESRVKAARGALDAVLTRGQPKFVLVKVHNEGGITPPLAVAGDELRRAGTREDGRWLEASVVAAPPGTLSGQKLEYVALRLTAHEQGKREATLKFDAGQGTQDLGFRAEVPILFRVVAKDHK
jgi:hypothetical protein